MEDSILSVSEFVELLNQTLEFAYPSVTIEGEVSGYRGPNRNGHHYFTLKDDNANIECVAFAGRVFVTIEDGMKLIIKGRPNHHPLYKFKFIVNEAKPSGDGAIKRAFELLKKKLEAEGLFSDDRKREIPKFPVKIGVVSSSQAAGYKDFIEILNTRWGGVEVFLADVQVQGDKSPAQIVKAIEYFNQAHQRIDVLIITRGGGSLEDLQSFNNEAVVRAIAASRTPTIVGVGHEIDVSLADLVADLRAATPTDAARLVVPDKTEFLYQVGVYERTLNSNLKLSIDEYRNTLSSLVSTMSDRLKNPAQQIDKLRDSILDTFFQQRQKIGYSLESSLKILRSYNPKRVLKSGYSLVRDETGKIVKSITSVKLSQKLMLELSDGIIEGKVTDVRQQESK